MFAIFNDKREILTIGDNVADRSNRVDYCLITSTLIPSVFDLKIDGCLAYRIDVNGVIERKTDLEMEEEDSRLEYQSKCLYESCSYLVANTYMSAMRELLRVEEIRQLLSLETQTALESADLIIESLITSNGSN